MKKITAICICSFLIYACSESPNSKAVETNEHVAPDTTAGIISYPLNEARLDAVAFNNAIFNIQQAVSTQVTRLFQSDSANISNHYSNTLFEIEVNVKKLENLKGPEDSDQLKKALMDLLEFYHTNLSNEFTMMIPLVKKSVLKTEEKRILREYDEEFAVKEIQFFKQISEAQNQFAVGNNIQLKDI